MSSKCEICHNEAIDNSRLCANCNNERLRAASLDRIWSGRGLNFENAEKFSEESWIRGAKEHEDSF